MMCVGMTLRARGESVHKFLVEACSAVLAKTAPPSLLPPSRVLNP
jgi:hypothetical protein